METFRGRYSLHSLLRVRQCSIVNIKANYGRSELLSLDKLFHFLLLTPFDLFHVILPRYPFHRQVARKIQDCDPDP